MARLLSFTVTAVRLRGMPMIKLEQSLTYGDDRSIGQCDVGHVFEDIQRFVDRRAAGIMPFSNPIIIFDSVFMGDRLLTTGREDR